MRMALTGFTAVAAMALLCAGPAAYSAAGRGSQKDNSSKPQLADPDSRPNRATSQLASDVRYELLTLPYYGVFDWLEAKVEPDATVILKGQVTNPSTKPAAAARVEALEGVKNVVDQIEVLPISPSDDMIRIAMYRAIFDYNDGLFQYATRAVPPIHILVDRGHVTLKGTVAREMDKQIAYFAAQNVSGVFEVKNEIVVEEDHS